MWEATDEDRRRQWLIEMGNGNVCCRWVWVSMGGDGFRVENWEKQMEIRGGIKWEQF